MTVFEFVYVLTCSIYLSLTHSHTHSQKEKCEQSYREGLLKAERLKLKLSSVKKDTRFFFLSKDIFKKEFSVTRDRAQYFCYKVS